MVLMTCWIVESNVYLQCKQTTYNYDTLQTHILIYLFKSYYCSFYGFMLGKYNSECFDKI